MGDRTDEAGIATRVRAARERAGMSREALAFHSGISWSAVTQVETGRRTNLRPATLTALADALGVTIDYLVRGHSPNAAMLQHRALFYAHEPEFLNAAEAFLGRGVDRAEAALVVTGQDKIDALRERLGTRAEHVVFGDQLEWYRSPSQALEGYRDFLRSAVAGGATWVRILGEPVWRGRGEIAVRQWSRYESVLNLVFGGEPVSVLCPYNTAEHDTEVIAAAYATHRHTVGSEAAGPTPSPNYQDPGIHMLQT